MALSKGGGVLPEATFPGLRERLAAEAWIGERNTGQRVSKGVTRLNTRSARMMVAAGKCVVNHYGNSACISTQAGCGWMQALRLRSKGL